MHRRPRLGCLPNDQIQDISQKAGTYNVDYSAKRPSRTMDSFFAFRRTFRQVCRKRSRPPDKVKVGVATLGLVIRTVFPFVDSATLGVMCRHYPARCRKWIPCQSHICASTLRRTCSIAHKHTIRRTVNEYHFIDGNNVVQWMPTSPQPYSHLTRWGRASVAPRSRRSCQKVGPFNTTVMYRGKS